MADVELPNPEELEEMRGKAFPRRVALTTAVFAMCLAFAALGGHRATKEMLLAQQQASDQWAFYQAKGIREHQDRVQRQRLEADLAEHGPAMTPQGRETFKGLLVQLREEEQRYHAEKQEIEHEAKTLEQERDISRAKDPYFEYAEVLLQIAIVMASIAIVSSSRPVFVFSLVLAVLGGLLTLNGYRVVMKIPFLHS